MYTSDPDSGVRKKFLRRVVPRRMTSTACRRMSLRTVRAAARRAGIDTEEEGSARTKAELCKALPARPRTMNECEPIPSRGGRRMRPNLVKLAKELGIDPSGLNKQQLCASIVGVAEAAATDSEEIFVEVGLDKKDAPVPIEKSVAASSRIGTDTQGSPNDVAIAASRRASASRYEASVTLVAAQEAEAALRDAEKLLANAETDDERRQYEQQVQRVRFLTTDLQLRAEAAQRSLDAYRNMLSTFGDRTQPAVFFDYLTLVRDPTHHLDKVDYTAYEPPVDVLATLYLGDYLPELTALFARLRARGVRLFVLSDEDGDGVKSLFERVALAPMIDGFYGDEVLQYVANVITQAPVGVDDVRRGYNTAAARTAIVLMYASNGARVAYVDNNAANNDAVARMLPPANSLVCCRDMPVFGADDGAMITAFFGEATGAQRDPVVIETQIQETVDRALRERRLIAVERYCEELQVLVERLRDDERSASAEEQAWLRSVAQLLRTWADELHIVVPVSSTPVQVETLHGLCTALQAGLRK